MELVGGTCVEDGRTVCVKDVEDRVMDDMEDESSLAVQKAADNMVDNLECHRAAPRHMAWLEEASLEEEEVVVGTASVAVASSYVTMEVS